MTGRRNDKKWSPHPQLLKHPKFVLYITTYMYYSLHLPALATVFQETEKKETEREREGSTLHDKIAPFSVYPSAKS